MAREFSRPERIGEQIRRELAELLRTAVKDPRAELVTVSEVNVDRELATARVHVTRLGGDPETVVAAVDALNGAAGYLRRELSRRMRLRRVPQLRFEADPSFDRGAHLSSLIDKAVAEDATHHPENGPDRPDDDSGN